MRRRRGQRRVVADRLGGVLRRWCRCLDGVALPPPRITGDSRRRWHGPRPHSLCRHPGLCLQRIDWSAHHHGDDSAVSAEPMRVGLSTALCVAMSLTVVTAHAPHVGADPRVFSSWDQATVIGLCVLATVYAIGAMRLAARSVQKSRVEYCAFGVGWFVLLFAVLPWIDAATIERFSAHMGQHELMMLEIGRAHV